MHTRRNVLKLSGGAAIAAVLPRLAAADPAKAKPNIVIILTDDQGWGDLSVSGNGNLATPTIDSLARDGATFDRFYVCPVCSPTRAEMLTGRYHPRGNVTSTSAGGERLDLDEKTIAETFKAAGYATAAFGKWHNGMQYPYHPNGRGFDEYYGFCSGHWGHYFSPPLDHNQRIVKGRGFVIDDFTDHAMDFMAKQKDKPFFCYLAYNTPHSPMQVPDRFFRKFDGADLKQRHRKPKREKVPHTRAALAMCENIDWNVGRLLKKLDAIGAADNTIVVYFSDNGPNGWRWNGGMKGRKGSTDEGGVRSPCFVRWPAKVRAGTTIPQIAGAIDLLPTLADAAGIPVAGDKPLDGVSVLPLLTGAAKRWPDRMIFTYWKGRLSVRTQRWRLDNRGRLFDMPADPGQKRDVTTRHPHVVARLKAAADKWRKDVVDGSSKGRRPFTVGHPHAEVTPLPARDGIPHGGIKRSNRFPNDSFFHTWTKTGDSITWDVEVLTAGTYDVVLYYTCPAKDVGSTVELSFGDAKVSGKVAEAHDPPLIGKAHDRTPRMESYVKAFKPMRLGEIQLAKARGAMTLRATKIPGASVMDIRYIVLTRQ